MTNEQRLTDTDGRKIGYGLQAVVLEADENEVSIEVRPNRSKSVILKILDPSNISEKGPLSNCSEGEKLRVLIVRGESDVSIISPGIIPEIAQTSNSPKR